MTTIVAVESKHLATIVAESYTTYGDRPYYHPDVKKITKSGSWLLAASGDARACDIITNVWKPPSPRGNKNLHIFVSTTVIKSLRKILSENEYTQQPKDDGFDLLMILNGQVFHITNDFTLLKSINGLYGIGSGSAYALGAIEAGADIVQAVRIAIELDINSGGPIQVEISERTSNGTK
jgi:ATP-dependent protease HslVU (ClpYQ) peptidase subunit